MVTKYSNFDIDNEVVIRELDRITNQIFKLLPNREEGGNWQTPLQNLILEITGMKELLNMDKLFVLLCKMEALLTLSEKDDFFAFRKLIFECLSIVNELKQCLD